MIKNIKDKFYKVYKKNNIICYAIIILIAVLIFIPLLKKGFIMTHDGTAHFSRNFGTIQGIKNGIPLSAIVPNFCGGFGYSWNLFYPPLSTYINAIFYFIIQNYIIDMKLTIMLAIACAGIFMFKFMINLTKNKSSSLIASIFYITSTYFIVDIYKRLAIGEIMVFVFLPLLFWGLYNIFYEQGKKSYLLTIGTVGIFLSHNISSLIVAILCFVIILFHCKKLWKKEDRKQIWKDLFINAFFIILIVSFFMLPLLEHRLDTEYVAMINNGMTSRELVINSEINLSQLIMTIGPVILLSLLPTLICYKKIDKNKRNLYIGILILGTITAIIATKIFPWNIMPNILLLIQFPWRILLFSTFFLSIIAGININICITNKKIIKFIIITFIAIIYSVNIMFKIIDFNFDFDTSYLYEVEKIENINSFSDQCTNYDYLPVKARKPYIQTRGDNVIVLYGNAQIKNETKEQTNMKFTVENNSEESILELPYIYYLGYSIEMNEKEIKYEESTNGFISITIPKEEKGIVEVKYTGTKLSKISTILSIIGIIGFIFYVKIKMNTIK